MPGKNDQLTMFRWMLEDIRRETLAGIDHLSKEQLFEEPVEGEFSIGSYLMHFAECDIHWLEVLSGIQQPEELKIRCYYNKWFDSGKDCNPPKEALKVTEYLDVIMAARKNFLDHVSSLDESDLEKVIIQKGTTGEYKVSKKWIIYHIIEHEAHHRGQMFMLIRKAGWNKKY